jgi:hypothetical protein
MAFSTRGAAGYKQKHAASNNVLTSVLSIHFLANDTLVESFF